MNNNNNNELLSNLLKKLEIGEIVYHFDGKNIFLIDRSNCENGIKIDELSVNKNAIESITNKDNSVLGKWNRRFKENFYKEKGLNKKENEV